MNNDMIDILCSRRSVKSYSDKRVSDDQLDLILKAGSYAPTGRNFQSPVMVAVSDEKVIEKLERINAEIMGDESLKPFYNAKTVIVVLADSERPTHIYDGSLVMGNLMNAAHSIGVDSCWIHRAKETFETAEGKELLKEWGLSEKYVGIGNCILGFAKGDYPKAKERKSDYIIKI